MSYPPLSVCREIREYIFLDNGIALGVLSSKAMCSGTASRVHIAKKRLPTQVEIFAKLCRHIATRLFDMVHNVRFVHHVPLTKRDEFFELVS
jgi:hypothetical protein